VYVQTLSKTYAMTGWRIGYVIAPPGVAADVQLVHRTLNCTVNTAVQRAAIAALTAGPRPAAPSGIVSSVCGYKRSSSC
jgi:aspartate aminotransferase